MFVFNRYTLASWLALSCACAWAAGGLAVIVNPGSGVDALSREEVSHLFLGRVKFLPSGVAAVVIDTEPVRERFYRALVDRGIAEINAYWARLRFSGRTAPPQLMEDPALVMDRVARERGAIGYVDSALVDKRVKAVFALEY
jgi:hypothetical protein